MASIAGNATHPPTMLWNVEHWSRRVPTLLVLAGLTTLLVTGTFGPNGAATWIQAIGLGILAAFDTRLISQRFGLAAKETRNTQTDDLIAGLFAVVSLYVALRFTGSYVLHLYPLAYVLVAYLATVNRGQVGTVLIVSTAGIELANWIAGHPIGLTPSDTVQVTMRIGFIGSFALLYVAFHRVNVLRSGRTARREVMAHSQQIELRGQELGLGRNRITDITSDDLDRETHRTRMIANAISGCERASYQSLRVLKHGLRARTAVLLWLDESGEHLQVRELVTNAQHVVRTPFRAGSGALGGVIRNKTPISLRALRHDYHGIAYYSAQVRVTDFLGVPVLEGDQVRGVLCVDRDDNQPFTETDETVLKDAAAQLVRTIQSERLIIDMEETRYELGRFYEASRALATVLDLDEVLDVSIDTVRSIAAFDMAAITLFDEESRMHTIARVSGHELEGLEGQVFQNDNGLVSAVVKLRHYLPCGGDFRNSRSWVFSQRTQKSGTFKDVQSLLVLPLVARDTVIGTFVIGAHESGALPRERREMLEVVANQVAVAIVNAQMYARMEKLATTDGLTRLFNRRTFLERMDHGLARADRASLPGSVILTDIDFFKKVNDTYGHAMGDEVLRKVAETFRETLRCTDVVGRYGGEEFVIYLEDTDLEGGAQMAERMREAVESLRFESEHGPFNVTISLGIAEYGLDAEERDALIDCADKALYACKHDGRNCSKTWRELKLS